MPSMDILSLSSSALRAYQNQISVIGNNISNVETVGYSRRTLDTSELVNSNGEGCGIQSGTVTRCFNALSAALLVSEDADYAYHSEAASLYEKLEALTGTSDGALSTALQEFEDAWNNVATNPEDSATRAVLLQSAASLASQFNTLSSRYDSFNNALESSTSPDTGLIAESVEEFNSITTRLQELNKKISVADATGNGVAALRDERDTLIRELCAVANVSVTPDYQVSLGGQEIVSADGSTRQELLQSGTTFTVAGNDISDQITGGTLAARADLYTTVETLKENLDLLAGTLATETNAIFNSACNLNGETPDSAGYTFFTGTDAASLAVDTTLYDPGNPMAMQTDLVAAAKTANSGDNSAALAIANLFETANTTLNNKSLTEYWSDIETVLASTTAEELESADTSELVVSMLAEQLQSTSGVNMDEELVNLMTAQNAYEACSRVFSTANKLLEELMNLV